MTDTPKSDTIPSNVVAIPAEPVRSRQVSVLWQLEEYWRSIALPGQIPFRHDVQPRAIGSCLSHVYLATIVGPGLARIRFAGQELSNIFGMDPRGMPLTTFFTPPGRVAVQRWFSEVFDRPAIIELPLISNRGIGRPKLTGGMVLMPLAAEDGTVSMALGALVTEGEPGRAPRRFDVPDGQIRIEPVAAEARPKSGLTPNAQNILRGLAPLAGPAAIDQAPAKPYLRLVVDNG